MGLINTFLGLAENLPILTEYGYVETRFLKPGISCITLSDSKIVKNKIFQITQGQETINLVTLKTEKFNYPISLNPHHRILTQTPKSIAELTADDRIAIFIGFSNIKRRLEDPNSFRSFLEHVDELMQIENTLFRTLFYRYLKLKLNRNSKYAKTQLYLSSEYSRFPRGWLRAPLYLRSKLLEGLRRDRYGRIAIRFRDIIDCYNCLETLEPIGYCGKIRKESRAWKLSLERKIGAFQSYSPIKYLSETNAKNTYNLLCSIPSLIIGSYLVSLT